jgi:hypothetical protein
MSFDQRTWSSTGSTLRLITWCCASEPGSIFAVAELGRAHGREVLRVREQDRPAVADPLVEIDLALGRVRGEVRSLTVYAQSHATLPIESKYSKVPFSTNPNTRGGFRVLAGAGVLAAREEERCRGS